MFSNAKFFTLFLALSLVSNVMGLSLSGFGLGLTSGNELINRNIVASTIEKVEEVFQVKPRKRSIPFGSSSHEMTAKHHAIEKRKKGGRKGGSSDWETKHGGHGGNGNDNGSSSSDSGDGNSGNSSDTNGSNGSGSDPSSQTTTTKSATPTTTSSSSSSGSASQTFSGEATWYTQGGVAGACGTVHTDQDFIVAEQYGLYGDGADCGRTVVITNTANGKSVTATVADECEGCATTYSLDLSVAAFDAIGDPNTGVLDITWYFSS